MNKEELFQYVLNEGLSDGLLMTKLKRFLKAFARGVFSSTDTRFSEDFELLV